MRYRLLGVLLLFALCAACAGGGAPASQEVQEAPSALPETAASAPSALPEEPEESAAPAAREGDDESHSPPEYEELTLPPQSKVLRAPVWSGGPEYTFTFAYTVTFPLDYSGNSADMHPDELQFAYAPVVITITDETGEWEQVLEEFRAYCPWGLSGFQSDIVENFALLDINRDGYLDIYLQQGLGGNRYNRFYRGWLWNPEMMRFEDAAIDNIYNPVLSPEEATIRSSSVASAAIYLYEIHRFVDGAFVMTDTLSLYYHSEPPIDSATGELLANYLEMEEGVAAVQVRRLAGGELQDVFPDMISDTAQGRRQIWDYLYGPESVWFAPQGPEFAHQPTVPERP